MKSPTNKKGKGKIQGKKKVGPVGSHKRTVKDVLYIFFSYIFVIVCHVAMYGHNINILRFISLSASLLADLTPKKRNNNNNNNLPKCTEKYHSKYEKLVYICCFFSKVEDQAI